MPLTANCEECGALIKWKAVPRQLCEFCLEMFGAEPVGQTTLCEACGWVRSASTPVCPKCGKEEEANNGS